MQLVKSKTPKVTLYTKYAKVMLMENTPNADLEVCFYDGESTVHVETRDPTEGEVALFTPFLFELIRNAS